MPTSKGCRSTIPARCSTRSGPWPRENRSPGVTTGGSAISCSGTTAARCIVATRSIPQPAASCTARRSKPTAGPPRPRPEQPTLACPSLQLGMAVRVCHHCKQQIEEGEAHDCWTTTEAALTRDLSEDLHDAWERLREAAASFGDQRIYASHNSIMFARKACYFFVRSKKKQLEVIFFLGRTLKAPQVRKTVAASRIKIAHVVHVTHRDEVEPPLTDWLSEA